MKRIIWLILIILTICTSGSAGVIILYNPPAYAGIIDHPSYARVNTITQSFVSSVSAKQADFFIANGYYFQGIELVTGQPDGVTDLDADTTKRPSDKSESWRDFDSSVFTTNLKIPVQVQINTYEALEGWGWELITDIWYDNLGPDAYGTYGSHWRYRHHEGPQEKSGIFDEWFIIPDAPW